MSWRSADGGRRHREGQRARAPARRRRGDLFPRRCSPDGAIVRHPAAAMAAGRLPGQVSGCGRRRRKCRCVSPGTRLVAAELKATGGRPPKPPRALPAFALGPPAPTLIRSVAGPPVAEEDVVHAVGVARHQVAGIRHEGDKRPCAEMRRAEPPRSGWMPPGRRHPPGRFPPVADEHVAGAVGVARHQVGGDGAEGDEAAVRRDAGGRSSARRLWAPPGPTLTRSVVPGRRSRTNTSRVRLVSPVPGRWRRSRRRRSGPPAASAGEAVTTWLAAARPRLTRSVAPAAGRGRRRRTAVGVARHQVGGDGGEGHEAPPAESEGLKLPSLAWAPPVATLTRSVAPRPAGRGRRCRTTPLVSPGTRLVALDLKATKRPSAEIVEGSCAPRCCLRCLGARRAHADPLGRAGGPARHSRPGEEDDRAPRGPGEARPVSHGRGVILGRAAPGVAARKSRSALDRPLRSGGTRDGSRSSRRTWSRTP